MNRGAARALIAAAVAAPALLALWFVAHYGVDVPYWDEWQYVPLLADSFHGKLSFAALFAQHNEHRILVPRLVFLALDHLTGFNTRAGMFGSWLCLAGITALLYADLRKTSAHAAALLLIPLAWAVFSLRQYENLLWGWQLQMCLCALIAVATFWLLQRGRTPLALAAGLAATYTFSAGMLVWPVGFLQLLAARARRRDLAAWMAGALFSAGTYAIGYAKPGHHPSLLVLFREPQRAFAYLLAAIGNPFATHATDAIVQGTVLLALCLAALFLAVRRGARTMGPALILFSLANALMLTVGRAGFGADQAVSSRYATFALLAPAGAYLTFLALADQLPAARALAVACATLFVAHLPVVDLDGLDLGLRTRTDRLQEVSRLRSLAQLPPGAERWLFPDPVASLPSLQFLRERHLSLFRTTPPMPRAPRQMHSGGYLDTINGVRVPAGGSIDARRGGDTLRVEGWAVCDGLCAAVWLTVDGEPRAISAYGLDREDVARSGPGRRSGFIAELGVDRLAPGPHELVMDLVEDDGGYVRMGTWRVNVLPAPAEPRLSGGPAAP